MVKKIRIEKWELYYGLLLMVLFGFWMGYILGGSSSWAAKPEVRDELIPNCAMIIACLILAFLLIKAILYFYRKGEIAKRKANHIQELK